MALEKETQETDGNAALHTSIKQAEEAGEAFWSKWGPRLQVTPAQGRTPDGPQKRTSRKKKAKR